MFIFLLFAVLSCTQDIPVAIEFTAGDHWDGNDGPWSTFTIGVGSPPQAIRVIPSVAQNIVTVVRPEECLGYLYGFQNCSEARGGVYRYNESSTWRSNGIHDVDPTNNSLFKRTLHFGTDTVGLGTKPQASRMTNQTVALMLQLPPSYIGIVGISPVPINYTEDNTQVPTFFESLRSSTRIGARTWSYTAGSFNRNIHGSLILGGFDASRIDESNSPQISINMTKDRLRELSVGLQGISVSDGRKTESSVQILSQPMVLPIEPMISRIWLPITICQQFERVLGLTWNTTDQLYYVSDTQHEDFLSRNLTITFTLSDPSMQGNTTKITFDYADFVLFAKHPLTEHPGRYFPIQRAYVEDQIVLGRAFLQAAYLLADYDRQKLNISQANLDAMAEKRVFSSIPPSALQNTLVSPPEHNSRGTLSTAAIAGICVAITSLIAILVLICLIRRRKQKQKAPSIHEVPSDTHRAVELEGNSKMAVEKDQEERLEMEGSSAPLELSPVPLRTELSAVHSPISELDSSPTRTFDGEKEKN